MTPDRLREILSAVERGERTAEQAVEDLRVLAFEDLGFAKVDHHRSLRRGFPEVIFGEGKPTALIVEILQRQEEAGQYGFVTRVSPEGTVRCTK